MCMPRLCRPALLFAGLLLLSGCGSSTPPLAPATGTVAYGGQPLSSGMIVFTPDPAKGSTGPSATALIQSDGSFVLHTGETPGAPAGWHRVTVVCIAAPEVELGSTGYAVPVSLIPEKYRSADLSGLSREVRMGEKNEFNLNLD